MGLLSDAQNRKKLGMLIVNHHRKVIALSFVTGVAWFLLLPSDNINNRTYFSENALLPGLVIREFNPGSAPYRLLESLKEESNVHASLPHAWIQGQFRQMGLDVYTHNFTLNYPFGSKPRYEGKNVYAILRAPKSCSTEALVLSTPYRGRDSIHETTLPSVALMIEIARYFRQHSYWSKDIIFLITEHEMIGFQAWLNAYHSIPSKDFIDHGLLVGTSGLIQGVINLEISHEEFQYVDVKLEGLNGQLPNLDLFNLIVELCNREMITPLFQGQKTFVPTFPIETWKHNFQTMVTMMGMQSMGLPTGGHGLFHHFGIQAMTIASKEGSDSSKVGFVHVGRVLEGIFRSLNNLLEKFHQSFFFYLLPSTRHYVSIGLYMPPFALIVATALIKALYLYIDFKFTSQKKQDVMFDSGFSLWSALDILIICHFLGFLIYFCPAFVDTFQNYFDLNTEDSFHYIHIILLCASVVFTFVFHRLQHLSQQQFCIKLCVVLLELGAFLFTLSLVNISLATALSLLYVPIGVCLGYRGIFSVFRYVYLLLINPIVLTYLIIVIQSYILHSDSSWNEHLKQGFSGHKKLVLYTIEDMYFFGNWNYKIVTLLLLPIWFELWSLVSVRSV